jgi:hypothetical protein
MKRNQIQPVATPANVATFVILFTLAVCLAMIVTTFHLADFGNFQTGFFWLISVTGPAAVVWVAAVHLFDKELAKEAARAQNISNKSFNRGFDNGYEEALYQAYLVLETWGGELFNNYEEFRGHIGDYS